YRAVFFFQAEDGIRDRNVTGVQTCALPIWVTEENRPLVDVGGPPLGRYGALTPRGSEQEPCRGQRFALCAWARSEGDPVEPDGRSEERRVGKEGRTRMAADHA